MSIYREESVEALTEALQKKAFPASQLKDLDEFLCLFGHLTNSGMLHPSNAVALADRREKTRLLLCILRDCYRKVKLRMSRLIQARLSLSIFSSVASSSRNLQFLSTESNKTNEPFKVEEAETIDVPPLPVEKLLVLGGNGFVGSHVYKEALDHGLTVGSLSRTVRSSIQESWANSVTWDQGNLL